MKFTGKKILSVMLAVLMIFSTSAIAFAADTNVEVVTGFTDEDFLKVKGRKMYNAKGEEVVLRGVNLGGWLVREDWLCPDHVPEDVQYDGEYVYNTLEERFGREKAQELLESYYENWITEWDLDNIKSMASTVFVFPSGTETSTMMTTVQRFMMKPMNGIFQYLTGLLTNVKNASFM